MKRAIVIGAGFSGLTSAYYLNKVGYHVTVREKSGHPGGLIKTSMTPWGQAESAANGFLSSLSLDELAQDIGLTLIPASSLSRRRYIFRSRPRRWPLSFIETCTLILNFLISRKCPRPEESVVQWGDRCLGRAARKYLLAPALQGIYAGDPDLLSSRLILGRFFGPVKVKVPRGSLKGTVAPAGGMGEFFTCLQSALSARGVAFEYGQDEELAKREVAAKLESGIQDEMVYVVAAGAAGAASVLSSASAAGPLLAQIDLLPIVTVTAFFEPRPDEDLPGFGCLMPRGQDFRVLGVLFNSAIFSNRSTLRSETWIFGGAQDRAVIEMPDAKLKSLITQERVRLYGRDSNRLGPMVGARIERWPRGIPHYTIAHEKLLIEVKRVAQELEKKNVYLVGNYLGSLGLSQILERVREVVTRVTNREAP